MLQARVGVYDHGDISDLEGVEKFLEMEELSWFRFDRGIPHFLDRMMVASLLSFGKFQ